MGSRGPASEGFDEVLFEEQLRSLRARTSKMTRKPPLDLEYTYTVFVLRLLWAVVVVPFLAGAALALLLGR
jgi:hypothetical protein